MYANTKRYLLPWIYSINNASGHFKPNVEGLGIAEDDIPFYFVEVDGKKSGKRYKDCDLKEVG